jgi:hypothetical protein
VPLQLAGRRRDAEAGRLSRSARPRQGGPVRKRPAPFLSSPPQPHLGDPPCR